MPASPSSDAKPASELRTIFTSFAAGVSAMFVAGLAVTLVADGGLSMPNAHAATLEQRTALATIEPLDLIAIQTQLMSAEQLMQVAQVRTDRSMDRLERLSH
jgi:hypothetical protein